MKFLKRIFSSTPVVLVFGLSIIVVGLFSLMAAVFAIIYYIEISISIGFISLIAILIVQYVKFRKPRMQIYEWETDSEKKAKLQNEKNWNEEFKLIVLSGFFVSVIAVANYWLGIVTAPIIFLIYGSFCLVAIYLIDKGRFDRRSRFTTESEQSGIVKQTGIPRTLINYFIVLALVSGFWVFQIQKNESQLKQDGYDFVNELTDLRYCESFQVNCVAVDSAKNISFKKVDAVDGPGKVWEICFSLNFEYSKYGGYYESDYRFYDYCFSNEYYGNSWPDSDTESEIYKELRSRI